LIEVQGLTKFYGDRLAIADVTFSVPRGQVLGFLGPNGAGKSTTMRILTGYISASGGRASIAGFDVFEEPVNARRRVGYLPQSAPLYNEMRVENYLRFACQIRGVAPAARRQRIDYAIEACGLKERRKDVIGRLSGGLRQRVGLAQAVVHDPDVLILDEPTAGLDPAQTRETRDLIVELGKQHTVILSSHILSDVSATCDRVLIINQGRLVADDAPANLGRRLSSGKAAQVELIATGDHEELIRAVESVPGVETVLVNAGDEGAWEITVTGRGTRLQDELAKAIISAGHGLRQLRSRTLSLEDIYLELTGADPELAAAEPASPPTEPRAARTAGRRRKQRVDAAAQPSPIEEELDG
jgi:ABC-2 type transport system ATP-binding protein